MVFTVKVVPPEAADADEAGALAGAAGVLAAVGELLLELAHADTVSARAASPATPHIFRIRIFPFTVQMISR
jgi:hypothetical protein